MNQYDLTAQIVDRLIHEYRFKRHGKHLRDGVCPSCKKKSLWTWLEKPGSVKCNRDNNCQFQSKTRDLFPDLFEDLSKKYPPTTTNPNETADAYLAMMRGFDLSKIKGWYQQSSYYHPHGDRVTAAVRFYLTPDQSVYWERLIDDVVITLDDGSKETRNKSFKGAFKGLWWMPPGMAIDEKDTVYLTEGILDAISLYLNGFKSVAIMSSGTFPSQSIELHRGKGVVWVFALDNDVAGRKALRKHAKRLRDMGENVGAALTQDNESKRDWNDLHKAQRLNDERMRDYRQLGRVELAQSHWDRARVMYEYEQNKTYFVYTFKNSTYSCKVDKGEYQKALELLSEQRPEMEKANKKDAFFNAAGLKEIATFKMHFLYFQQPDNGEDGQYFFSIHFSNKAAEVQLPFPGKTFGGAGDFKKAIMHKTPSALFTGSTKDLDYMYQQWMGRIPKIVRTLDYTGYDRESGAYVYTDYAVEQGRVLKLNSESFFQLQKEGIKTTVDIKQRLNTQMPVEWLPDYQSAFGVGGMVALAWWFGCLFVEQVRQQHRSYPFFEIVGEAGSGKSDMVDFLWKLYGREGESFNPNSSTLAGRHRKMAEVSGMPVVFNETDNEKTAEDRHSKKFNWDEIKDLFDGEFGRVTGVKSQDNRNRKPTFKAGLMNVQNIPIQASEAIMTRIVHLQFDRSHHTPAGKLSSDRLNALPVLDVSGFMLASVQKAAAVLEQFNRSFVRHKKMLQSNPAIKLQRIIENHAKIMAFADCLPLVLPVHGATVAEIQTALVGMAETRQESLNEDHPLVQQFWANFDYINSKPLWSSESEPVIAENVINHSMNPDDEIAVNLEHFRQRCSDLNLELIDTKQLRRYLPTSRARAYMRNEPIRSRLERRTIRCWIFKR